MASLKDRNAYMSEVQLDLPPPAIPVIPVLPDAVQTVSVSLPWGTTLSTQFNTDSTNCGKWISDLVGQIQPTMAAVQPAFMVVDVLMALVACTTAIPESILTLNPQPLFDCITGLVEAITTLICATYPPFAWPAMILSIFAFITSALECVYANIQAICTAKQRIANLKDLIGTDPSFANAGPLLTSAEANLDAQVLDLQASLGQLTSLTGLVNSFTSILNDIAGSEVLPIIEIEDISEMSCQEVLDSIGRLLNVLQAVSAVTPPCP